MDEILRKRPHMCVPRAGPSPFLPPAPGVLTATTILWGHSAVHLFFCVHKCCTRALPIQRFKMRSGIYAYMMHFFKPNYVAGDTVSFFDRFGLQL